MFRDLPEYARKRASDYWGIDLPEHWKEVPGFAVLEENKRKNYGLVEDRVLSLSYGKVIVKPVDSQRGLVPESYEGYQILDPGDIAVRPTDLQNDQTSIRVGHVKDRGIITSAYIGLRPRGAWSDDYAFQVLTVLDSTKRIYGMGSGLRQQLGWTDLKRLPCIVPPAKEQAAIVKYLAHANARIDNAIAAKRRLIALLEEQMQVLIERAISECTARFERLGFHIDLLTGFPFKSEDFRTTRGGGRRPLIRGINVGVSSISSTDYVFVDEDVAQLTKPFELRTGDLVLGMDRPIIAKGVRLAKIGSQQAGCLLVQRVARLRTKSTLDPTYLQMVFRSAAFTRYLEPIFTGISVPHLSPKQIRDFPIAIPNIEEQHAIVAAVDSSTTKLESAASAAAREISLLQEFRTRLVADVVTGQVDVRAVAATLPDVPESVSATEDVPTESDGWLEHGDE